MGDCRWDCRWDDVYVLCVCIYNITNCLPFWNIISWVLVQAHSHNSSLQNLSLSDPMFDNESSIYCFSYHTECKYTAVILRSMTSIRSNKSGSTILQLLCIFYNIFNDIFLNTQ